MSRGAPPQLSGIALCVPDGVPSFIKNANELLNFNLSVWFEFLPAVDSRLADCLEFRRISNLVEQQIGINERINTEVVISGCLQQPRDAKESEVARDREGWVAVYLHRSCLQPMPIAKRAGQNMKRNFDFGLAE